MGEGEVYQFRVFLSAVPRFVQNWTQRLPRTDWDRHYLLTPGHGLRLAAGERVELTRLRSRDGFRVEEILLSARFPLDWMSLSLIGDLLPRALQTVELDGRSAQQFVDMLAFLELPQASVLKERSVATAGAITATTTRLTVPAWTAAAVSVAFESANPGALRAMVSSGPLRGLVHRDLDDWLRQKFADANSAKAFAVVA